MQVTFVTDPDTAPTIKISLDTLEGNREEILDALDIVHKDFKRLYPNHIILVKAKDSDIYILG